MLQPAAAMKSIVQDPLVCLDCGNKDRFIEVMAEEIHLVNGNRRYLRLLEGIVDHYVCPECGAPIEADELEKT